VADYEKIIEELGHKLHFPLTPEKNGAVAILIEGKLRIQIERDPEERYLIVAATISDLSPGPARAKIVRNALRANASPYPRYGIFAYSRQANQLLLFDRLLLEGLSGGALFDYLELFTEKAWAWTDGIHRGQVPEPAVRKITARPEVSHG
jgi:Tir chaperone protein (CesT) family